MCWNFKLFLNIIPDILRKSLVSSCPFFFQFSYAYRVKYMKIGPTGTADGKVTNLRMKVVLSADMNTFLMKLNSYDIVNAG